MTVNSDGEKAVIFVMDYAFGEQAYETIDELLRPFEKGGKKHYLKVESISVMGESRNSRRREGGFDDPFGPYF